MLSNYNRSQVYLVNKETKYTYFETKSNYSKKELYKTPHKFFSWDINYKTEELNAAAFENSGLVFTFTMTRSPYFYMTYYLVPSIIFVLISYCSFWIDKHATTARCFLAITTVLITI